MKKNDSWVKLYRSILDWEWYTDINTKTLFIHLLLVCNFKDKTWRNIKINRGQLITGRKVLSSQTGLSEQQIRTALEKLIITKEVTKVKTNGYTLLTLINYDKYQTTNSEDQPRNNQGITKDQPQLKKGKKERNISTTSTVIEKIKNNFKLLESMAKDMNVSVEDVQSKIEGFVLHNFSINKIWVNDSDLFSHFKYSIKKRSFDIVNESEVTINLNWFIKQFNQRCKGSFKGTKKVKELFVVQLNNGFTGGEMKTAIDNLFSSDDRNFFHKKSNFKFATPEYLLKNDNLNKYLNTFKVKIERKPSYLKGFEV